jgi:hypothetical protein
VSRRASNVFTDIALAVVGTTAGAAVITMAALDSWSGDRHNNASDLEVESRAFAEYRLGKEVRRQRKFDAVEAKIGMKRKSGSRARLGIFGQPPGRSGLEMSLTSVRWLPASLAQGITGS